MAADSFFVDGGAENPLHFAEGEGNGLAQGGARFDCRDAHIDEFALDGAAVGKEDRADYRGGNGRGAEVGATLEAMAGVSVQAVAARGAANRHGIKPGRLDEYVFCGGRDHGVPAAHDAGQASNTWCLYWFGYCWPGRRHGRLGHHDHA